MSGCCGIISTCAPLALSSSLHCHTRRPVRLAVIHAHVQLCHADDSQHVQTLVAQMTHASVELVRVHLTLRRVFVQPDRGPLCAFWLAALVATLEDAVPVSRVQHARKQERAAALAAARFQLLALHRLTATLYVFTGDAVPSPLRARLAAAIARLVPKLQSAISEVTGTAMTPGGVTHLPVEFIALSETAKLDAERSHACHTFLLVAAGDAPMLASSSALRTMAARMPQVCANDPQCEDQVCATISSSLSGSLLWGGPADLTVPSQHALAINAQIMVRGCGLASSAYGLLHHPATVYALFEKWTSGPWANRLKPVDDFMITYQTPAWALLAEMARPSMCLAQAHAPRQHSSPRHILEVGCNACSQQSVMRSTASALAQGQG